MQAEVRGLASAVDRAEGDVDFFLTCEWPANVTALCAPGSVPAALDSSGAESPDLHMDDRGSLGACPHPSLPPPGMCDSPGAAAGSAAVADLALKVRPRYHIAGGKGAFFARVPYLNKDLGAGECHSTPQQ